MYNFFEIYGFPENIIAETIIEKDDDGNETYEIPEKLWDDCVKFWKRVGFLDDGYSRAPFTEYERRMLARNLSVAGAFVYANKMKEHTVFGLDMTRLIFPVIVRLFRRERTFMLDNPKKLIESMEEFYKKHHEHFERLSQKKLIDIEAQFTLDFADYVVKKCAEDE